MPGPSKAPNLTAQADTGANQARLAGAIQWGDDNPPRLIALGGSAMADTGRHARVEVEVGPDGQVISVRLVESSGDPKVDAAALDTARKSSFAPATLNGLPVHGKCTIEFPSGLAST
jgi:TonB family protein